MRRAEFDLAAERQLRAELSRKRVRLPRKHKRGVLAYRSEKGVSAPWLRRLPELALLDVLAVDNVCARVMRQLDCAAVGACLLACRDLGSAVAVHADWQALCAEMWADKVFVPAAARQLQKSARTARQAFYFAVRDAARTVITKAELVEMVWQTRVKATMGEGALEVDPWHNGKHAVYVRCNADHTVDRELQVGPQPGTQLQLRPQPWPQARCLPRF